MSMPASSDARSMDTQIDLDADREIMRQRERHTSVARLVFR